VLSDERKFHAPALRATFCKNNNPLKQHGDSGTVEFFFRNGGDQMPFDMHVDRFTYLLKRWHAEQSGSPLKTSEAKASLQAYIYLACRQKLYSRIRRGKRQRNAHGKPYGLNIYQFLTIDDVNFKLKHDQIHKDRLSNDLPSEDERTVLEEWARVAKFTAEEKTDLAERPVYDMAGRKRFHRILRLALITSSEAVTGLLEAVNEQMAKPLEVGSAGEIKRFSAIRTMAVQAAMLFEMLSDFIFSFHTTLVKHLEWLEVVFHLERTTKTPLQSSSDPPSSYVPPSSPPSNVVDGSDFQPPSDIEQQIPSTPFEDDEKDVVTLDEENFVKLTEKLGLAEVGEDEEDEQDDTDQIQELLRKGWHVAALKYLDVICLYTDALTNLERGKLTTAIVLGLDIQVISATLEFKDNVMLPVKAVLDDTYFCSDEEERSAIVKFIMNQSYIGAIHHRSATEPPDTELEVPFNGTWHCEAILLSLAIAKVGCIE
jgi:hypothetical protein